MSIGALPKSITDHSKKPPVTYNECTRIANGGNAVVYSAKSTAIGPCAIKYYASSIAARNECAYLQQLENVPCRVKYITHFKIQQGTAIVLELVEGGDLTNHQKHFSRFAILHVAIQILKFLSSLHKKNLIYGDLKPRNTLYDTATRCVKVADFESISPTKPPLHYPIVTLCNRPIEVFLGAPYDTSIDMYSFGCLLFYLITGKQLFYIDSMKDDQLYRQRVVNLICAQIEMPSQEALRQAPHVNHFFRRDKDGYLSKKIEDAYFPWQATVGSSCRNKNILRGSAIDLIKRCLQHTGRLTAEEALKHDLFKSQIACLIEYSIHPIPPQRLYRIVLSKKAKDSQEYVVHSKTSLKPEIDICLPLVTDNYSLLIEKFILENRGQNPSLQLDTSIILRGKQIKWLITTHCKSQSEKNNRKNSYRTYVV